VKFIFRSRENLFSNSVKIPSPGVKIQAARYCYMIVSASLAGSERPTQTLQYS